MSNSISFDGNMMIVEPSSVDKFFSFTNKLTIPFNNIVGATVDKGIINTFKGVKRPGLSISGHKWCGVFQLDNHKSFWNVTNGETPLVITLKNEKYDSLILGVNNAKTFESLINNLL
ncbi:hypothetical protein [Apilactobacillus xinyiensis]|uniref:Bacterial Pleckstrin homology domain-containing protein n=1 Tax=Apilactobacillus xinyiensis TaxID=2841032 RepID=A0ABT0I2C9_9LACO|nr:hypothetical protein [Apilactobacillus xinyiensis]MCK8624862.1 hypothetical protein [Apilactobacillus xinyiensis]